MKNPANPERVKAMIELRRSNAAGPHTPKLKKGSRGDRRRAAIKEQTQNS